MASLQQEPTGTFHVVVFFEGKRYKRSLRTKRESAALVRKDEIEETLGLVKRGRLIVPPSVNTIDFVLAGGRLTANLNQEISATIGSAAAGSPDESNRIEETHEALPKSLRHLLEQFLSSIPKGSLEDNTLSQMETHRRHLLRLIGGSQSLETLAKTVCR